MFSYVILLCYISKSRLDVRFVKLEMVIGQKMKEEEHDQS